jgi:hypothetical protein
MTSRVRAISAGVMLIVAFATITAIRAADLPNPEYTPGKAEPRLTVSKLCARGFTTKSWRHVSASAKHRAYANYGLQNHKGDCAASPEGCEVDHLISLEIGGSNEVSNLWPQAYGSSPWNAHVKDDLENHLHKLVCDGTMSLEEAQVAIKTDWIAAWKKVFGRETP